MVNFHAHPDDEAIATSGTMMKAADEQFADAFGTEWYVAPGPPRTGDFATDLFR